MHHLLPSAHHIHCGLLSRDDALKLLLASGEVHLPPDEPPPPAAYEIIELCGRLPLTIALAGAMMQEHADNWERALVPLLRRGNKAALRTRPLDDGLGGDGDSDEEGGETAEAAERMEDRVITSSLNLLRTKKHHAAVVLFQV